MRRLAVLALALAAVLALASTASAFTPTARAVRDASAQLATYVKGRSAAGDDVPHLVYNALVKAAQISRARFPRMSPQDRSDMVMALGLCVFNGCNQWQAKIAQVTAKSLIRRTPKTRTAEFAKLAAEGDVHDGEKGQQTFAGGHLDSTSGGGSFYPKFNDKTKNQAFHCFFFACAGQASGKSITGNLLVALGNLKHEWVDGLLHGGGTPQDYHASKLSAIAGTITYQITREISDKPECDLVPAAVFYGLYHKSAVTITNFPGFAAQHATTGWMTKVARQVQRLRAAYAADYYKPGTFGLHATGIVRWVAGGIRGLFGR